MIGDILKTHCRYYFPLKTAVLGILSVAMAATAWGLVGEEPDGSASTKIIVAEEPFSLPDLVHEQRVKFASAHGAVDPVALVAAVSHSPMANLLISVAIEESNGDPVAVGAAGEEGAWQVMSLHWGVVPRDLSGQAGQAEKIINGLLIESKGNKIKALARYNGGTTPPDKSYRYAKRILKRVGSLQAAVKRHRPNYFQIMEAMLLPPRSSRLL